MISLAQFPPLYNITSSRAITESDAIRREQLRERRNVRIDFRYLRIRRPFEENRERLTQNKKEPVRKSDILRTISR